MITLGGDGCGRPLVVLSQPILIMSHTLLYLFALILVKAGRIKLPLFHLLPKASDAHGSHHLSVHGEKKIKCE